MSVKGFNINGVTQHYDYGSLDNQPPIGDLNNLITQDKSTLVAAINEAAQTGGGSGDINSILLTYLIPILQAGVYVSDQSDNIDALASALSATSGISISYSGTTATISNLAGTGITYSGSTATIGGS